MRYLPVTIQDKIAVYASTERLICYNSDYVLQFTFDAEWETYTQKTAQIRYFQRSGGWVKHNIIFSGVECAVPVIPNASVLYVGVYAGDISTSTEAEIPCRPSALSFDGSPAEPPEDVYNQIMDLLNKLGETGASPEQIQAVLEQYIADGNLTPDKVGAVAQNQGQEHADKILGIDASGEVVPVDKPSGGTKNAVIYTEQELTAEEQAQARENIGAEQESIIVEITGNDTAGYKTTMQSGDIQTYLAKGRNVVVTFEVGVMVSSGFSGYFSGRTTDIIDASQGDETRTRIRMRVAGNSFEGYVTAELYQSMSGDYILVYFESISAASNNYGSVKADPAESTDTVPARIGEDGKLYVDALPSSTLQSAINTALAQAKESGEFDGEDGTSVTITNTTESTEDGGENVVEFSDGNKLTVRNGKTGAQGDPGVYVGSEDTMPEGTIVRIDPDGEAMELVEVDDTLKLQGYAADAKVTGEKLDELSEAIADKVTGAGIKSIVALTQAEFDAIAEKDAATLYIVTDASTSDDGTVEPGNPSDMIPVLRSDGTAYINLGIEPIDGAKYEVCFRGVNDLSTKGVFGNRYTKVSGAGGSEIEKAWVCGYYNNSAYASFGGGTIDLTTKHIFTLTNTAIILDNDIVTEITEGTGAKDSVMLLFSSNNADTEGGLYGTTPCAIDLFYLRIWDGEDNLLHEYLPATDTEGVACIYDSVAKEYLYNAAESGAFEYREELEES